MWYIIKNNQINKQKHYSCRETPYKAILEMPAFTTHDSSASSLSLKTQKINNT
jgi:hypothetical protein